MEAKEQQPHYSYDKAEVESRASPEAHVSDGLVTPVSDKKMGIALHVCTMVHMRTYTYLHIHPHVHTEIKEKMTVE